jgi:hypothetical protein
MGKTHWNSHTVDHGAATPKVESYIVWTTCWNFHTVNHWAATSQVLCNMAELSVVECSLSPEAINAE